MHQRRRPHSDCTHISQPEAMDHGNICTELKARAATFKEWETNPYAYKKSRYALRQTIKKAKCQYRTKIESYTSSEVRRMFYLTRQDPDGVWPTPAKFGRCWANCRPMGLPIMSDCDTAWNRTRVCSDASSTEIQCLRPLRHYGALHVAGLANYYRLQRETQP